MKRITGDELPDFYNIVLERPKNDPDGYDVLFIDAAAKVGGGRGGGGMRMWGHRKRLRRGQAGGQAGRHSLGHGTAWHGLRALHACLTLSAWRCPAGRAGEPHEPQLHSQLPGNRDGLRGPPHHRPVHAAPSVRRQALGAEHIAGLA